MHYFSPINQVLEISEELKQWCIRHYTGTGLPATNIFNIGFVLSIYFYKRLLWDTYNTRRGWHRPGWKRQAEACLFSVVGRCDSERENLGEQGMLGGKCSFSDYCIVQASSLFWIHDFFSQVSGETLFLPPPCPLVVSVAQPAGGCEQHVRMAQCPHLLHGLAPSPSSHLVATPGAFPRAL